MTRRHLVWRTIRHYRGSSLAVVAGLAVATAVISGSLIIGSSLRGSLFDLALDRLGGVNHAAVLPRSVSDRVVTGTDALPLLQTTGSATPAMGEPTPVPVVVWGLDDKARALIQLPPQGDGLLINAALARDLQVKVGDDVALSVNRPRAIGMDSLFARRKLADVMATLQLPIAAILPDNGPGDFRLDGQSARPRNVFIPRDALARALDLRGKANVLLAPMLRGDSSDLTKAITARLALADCGSRLRIKPRTLALTSEAFTLKRSQVETAEQVANELGGKVDPVSVYLATRIRAPNGRDIAYAIIAGNREARRWGLRDDWPGSGNAVALNTWAAQDLQAKPRDTLTLEYLVPNPDGSFLKRQQTARLVSVVPIQGPTADAHLMPEYEGLTDAVTLSDWKPPFPIDTSRITPRDEAYWERYKTVPKAFLPLAMIEAMWGSSDSYVTSVEITPPAGQAPAVFASRYGTKLLEALRGVDGPIVFSNVLDGAQDAAAGTTDFSQLFLALSMFIIAAGIGLAAMLVRLGIERRTKQIGLMLAVGMTAQRVRRLMLAEGMILNLGGVLLGLPLGVLYAAALIRAMSLYWRVALGDAPALWLHTRPLDPLIGAVAGLLIGRLSIHLSLRGLHRLDPVGLWQYGLRRDLPSAGRRGASRQVTALVAMLLPAVGLLAWSLTSGGASRPIAFFGAGALLLGAAMPALSLILTGGRRGVIRHLRGLAWRNASVNARRSQLVFGLIAAASFVLVATAASTRNLGRSDTFDRDSGTGGYNLVATSTVPLPYDPSTPEGRRNLGLGAADDGLLSHCEIVSMLASPGDDLSCLSASSPNVPRLLARPDGLQLKTDYGPRSQAPPHTGAADQPVAAVGDADTVMWRLHLKQGAVWETQDAYGRPLRLRIEGLLHRSIFAGYLLVGERDFRRLFADVTAPSFFLIRTPREEEAAVMAALRRSLGDLGLQIRPSREILAEYAEAQNVYISMFLALGALGLLLGTVGLAVVTVRNIVERRAELALLAATGFSPRRLTWLLLAEHGGLVVLGLLLGAATAFVAMIPQLSSAESSVHWLGLGVALAAVLVVGLGSNLIAIRRSLDHDLIGALRHE